MTSTGLGPWPLQRITSRLKVTERAGDHRKCVVALYRLQTRSPSSSRGKSCLVNYAAAQVHHAMLHGNTTDRMRGQVCCASQHSTLGAPPESAAGPTAAVLQQERDMLVKVKIGVARSTGRIDLSDLRLTDIPADLFEIHDLEDLALSGNCLTTVPEAIGNLTQLKRLGLTGNRLTSVPASLGKLTQLEGLWLHGNLLTSIPEEIGRLTTLQQLSVAGNRLTQLPDVFDDLHNLYEFAAPGNLLHSLPPSLGLAMGVKKLTLNGNRLRELPDSIGGLSKLVELSLQGNELARLPDSFVNLRALKELSVADNKLSSLPEGFASLSSLEKFWAYGNRLTHLPRTLTQAPALASVWLEANPLEAESVVRMLERVPDMAVLRGLGLDSHQVAGIDPALIAAAGPKLKIGEVLGGGRGYFKLQPAMPLLVGAVRPDLSDPFRSAANERDVAAAVPPRHTGSSALGRPDAATAVAGNGMANVPMIPAAPAAMPTAVVTTPVGAVATSNSSGERVRQPLLIVAFSSAPGLPNWGELLARMRQLAKSDAHRAFDVLFVVDPGRSWFGGTDVEHLAHYRERLQRYTQQYSKVMLLGDSMGATAALLFAPLATAVLAFCPQVDMDTASIRPSGDEASLLALRGRVIDAVAQSTADIRVFTGTWKHDLDQVNMLPQHQIKSRVFSLDTHRLTAHLNQVGKLVPMVQEVALQQLGIQSGAIRLQNLL